MHYPSWSSLENVTLPAWLRAGQLCICSEDPNNPRSRVGIDCWLGDRWATDRPWALILQIPPLSDPDWHRDLTVCPTDIKRPVVLAINDPRHSGFCLGRCLFDPSGRWLMHVGNQWLPVSRESILGWLAIPQRLSRRDRQPLTLSRERLLATAR